MKTKKLIISLFFISFMLCLTQNSKAQVTIGSENEPNKSAILDLVSSNQGLLLPRLALTKTADATPLAENKHVKGMTVYNTAKVNDVTPGVYYNDGTKWVRMSDTDTVLDISGEYGIVIEEGENNEISIQLPPGNGQGDKLVWNSTTEKWVPQGTNFNVIEIADENLVKVAADVDMIIADIPADGQGGIHYAHIYLPTEDVAVGKIIYLAGHAGSGFKFVTKNGVYLEELDSDMDGALTHPEYYLISYDPIVYSDQSNMVMYMGDGKWAKIAGK